jgi:4-hydroxybenzoate polyprenyltransferase
MSRYGLLGSYLSSLNSRKMVIPIYTFPAVINLLISSHLTPNITETLLLVLSVTLISYSVYWYNDYIDTYVELGTEEFKETTHSQRPLAKGLVTKNQFLEFILSTSLAGLLLAYMINIYVLALQVTFLALGYIYSTEPMRLKRRFTGKQLTIIAGCTVAGLSGALVNGTVLPQNMYSLLINSLVYLSGSSLGDVRDVSVDRKIGVRTFPVVLGPELTIRFALGIFVAVILAGFVGYIGLGFNLALPLLTTIVMAVWIFSTYPLIRRWRDSVYVEKIVWKRIVPMNILVQVIPLVGILAFR